MSQCICKVNFNMVLCATNSSRRWDRQESFGGGIQPCWRFWRGSLAWRPQLSSWIATMLSDKHDQEQNARGKPLSPDVIYVVCVHTFDLVNSPKSGFHWMILYVYRTNHVHMCWFIKNALCSVWQLWANDQLSRALRKGHVFKGFQ